MQENLIIPFGKYKGKPLSVLTNDQQYLDWLTSQDWFKSRYPQLNTIIVNNFNEPNDTPEHNALVALFMDDDFVHKFISIYTNGLVNINRDYNENDIANAIYLETMPYGQNSIFRNKDAIVSQLKNGYKILNEGETSLNIRKIFETKSGNDIAIMYKFEKIINIKLKDFTLPDKHYYTNNGKIKNIRNNEKITEMEVYVFEKDNHINIECKPTISDDYPTIIRQCRSQGSNCILTYQYTGQGATLEQVRKMFPDIKIIQVNEIQ